MPLEQVLQELAPLRQGTRDNTTAERLITQANTLAAQDRTLGQPAAYQQAQERLRDAGILPNLMIQEGRRMDNNNDGYLSEREVQRVIGMGRNAPFLQAVAARGLRGTLQEMGGDIDPASGEYRVSLTRFEAYWRARQQPQGAPEAQRPETPGAQRPETPEAQRRQQRPEGGRPPEGQLPPGAQNHIELIQSGRGTPQEQLAAVRALHAMGVTNITLRDYDGQQYQCRIQVAPVGRGSQDSYVHLYARGEDGRENILLRGVGREGNYRQQVGNDGRPVSYTGNVWQSTRPNSILTPRAPQA